VSIVFRKDSNSVGHFSLKLRQSVFTADFYFRRKFQVVIPNFLFFYYLKTLVSVRILLPLRASPFRQPTAASDVIGRTEATNLFTHKTSDSELLQNRH